MHARLCAEKDVMETRHVVCAVIEHDQRILAAKRLEPVNGKYWEFPGGKVEENEDATQALVREISEELDITLESVWPLDKTRVTLPDGAIELEAFGTHLPQGQTPKLHVHSEFMWVNYDQLFDVDWLDADAAIMQAVAMSWGDLFYGSRGC